MVGAAGAAILALGLSSPASGVGTSDSADARIISFETREGTGMTVSVSPDGGTLLFDLLGHIYRIPSTGGRATQLTQGRAYFHQPAISPDGESVAYISDEDGTDNLWIADREFKNRRPVSNLTGTGYLNGISSPTWSPDGRLIAVAQLPSALQTLDAASTAWSIAAYDVHTKAMTWLLRASDIPSGAFGPAFEPGTNRVWASAGIMGNQFTANKLATNGPWRLISADLRTHEVDPDFGARPQRLAVRPVFSINGRYLSYLTWTGDGYGLVLRDRANGLERLVVSGEPEVSSTVSWASPSTDLFPGYAFSPDAQTVFISLRGKLWAVSTSTGESVEVPFVAPVERVIHRPRRAVGEDLTAARPIFGISNAVLSPRGDMLAYSALGRIWIAAIPSQRDLIENAVPLTSGEDSEDFPSWSPTGEWLAFSTWNDASGGSVACAKLRPALQGQAQKPQILSTDEGVYSQTAVSPDGNTVLAVFMPAAEVGRFPPISPFEPLLEVRGTALVSISRRTGVTSPVVGLDAQKWGMYPQTPSDRLYFAGSNDHVMLGPKRISLKSGEDEDLVSVTARLPAVGTMRFHVLSPRGDRWLVAADHALFEVVPSRRRSRAPAPPLDLHQDRDVSFAPGASRRHSSGLQMAVSWSRDGSRALVSEGREVFIGEARKGRWLEFRRLAISMVAKADVPHGTLALVGAKVISMRGDAVVENGQVIVRDGRIVDVSARNDQGIPADARILDVAGKTILPGYVDNHDHTYFRFGRPGSQQEWRWLGQLATGVTTSHRPGSPNEIFAQAERERAGSLIAPRLFSAPLSTTRNAEPRNGYEAVSELVSTSLRYGTHIYKLYAGGTSRRDLDARVRAADTFGLATTFHIERIQDLVVGVINGVSGVEHPGPNGTVFRQDVLQFHAASGVTQTMTYGVWGLNGLYEEAAMHFGPPWEQPRGNPFVPPAAWIPFQFQRSMLSRGLADNPEFVRRQLKDYVANAQRIVNTGGLLAMGAHGNYAPFGMHYEMWTHAWGGMRPKDILRAATINGATFLGLGGQIGSLEAGKLADLQVLDGDPSKDIRNTMSVRYVMKNGRLYAAENLTEIWPRCKPLPDPYLYGSAKKPADVRARQCLDGRHLNP